MEELKFSGDLVPCKNNDPLKLSEMLDGWRGIFIVCCQCGLTHTMCVKGDQVKFLDGNGDEREKISKGIATKMLELEFAVAELQKQNLDFETKWLMATDVVETLMNKNKELELACAVKDKAIKDLLNHGIAYEDAFGNEQVHFANPEEAEKVLTPTIGSDLLQQIDTLKKLRDELIATCTVKDKILKEWIAWWPENKAVSGLREKSNAALHFAIR